MRTTGSVVREVAPGQDHFDALDDVLEQVDAELIADDAFPEPPGYLATGWVTADARRAGWVAVDGTDVVGAAVSHYPSVDNTHLVEVDLGVPPGARGRGHGRALLEQVLRGAQQEGRDTVLLSTGYRPGAAEVWRMHERAVLDPSLSACLEGDDTAGTRLARSVGATVVQTELRSQVALPVPASTVRSLEAEAAGRSSGYRTVVWAHDVPEALLEDRASLGARMSTDPPMGDMDYRPEVWDAARVRRLYADHARRGLRIVGAGALEQRSGRLVAFSEVATHPGAPTQAWQLDTLVVPEHRGHRLGTVVKAATLRVLHESYPAVLRVETWNALENGPMLRVNRTIGFRPVALYAVWQLRLEP